MTCPRLEEVLSADASPDALAHAKGCPECGPARAAWDGMGALGLPSSEGLAAARRVALEELTLHPRARAWWVDALVLFAVNLAVATVALSLVSWPQVQHDSPLMRWGVAAGLLALIGVGSWSAIQPGAPVARLASLAFAAVMMMLVGLSGSGAGPDGPLLGGKGCAGMEALFAVLPLAVALWVTARFAFDAGRALVGGASVGATGALVLHLHCPNGTTAHLVAFHVLPWLLLAGATLGVRRLLPSRSWAP